jgi:hypothetical protein
MLKNLPNCDVATVIGGSHRVNEDYATCNPLFHRHHDVTASLLLPPADALPHVVVADGCSDCRSPDTDVGARILAKVAQKHLNHPVLTAGRHFYTVVLAEADAIRSLLALHPRCLDATLLTAAEIEVDGKRCIRTTVFGDGVEAAETRDGNLEITVHAFPPVPPRTWSIPYYPSYELDPTRLKQMLDLTGGNRRLQTRITVALNKDPVQEQGVEMGEPYSIREYPPELYKYVAVFSDGVHSFVKDRQPIPCWKIVQMLLRFGVAHRGQFAQRAMNGLLRWAKEEGQDNYDDVTYGVVYAGDRS